MIALGRCTNLDQHAEALREFWLKFDEDPPAAEAFTAARRVCPESLIRETIAYRAELGPGGLDALRMNLVDELRRRAAWEPKGA